ncbi:hypothetical protein ACFQWB_04935 [Paenibacillus thermoaerophilus]|uniref:SWIM-type domain-containing protein n=1 Tax=Paenibacillus thermoaerophilus TaxID=1215385 RepID=A0ABW2V1B2_9BACL|nr:hypothetical protein [Paenibacillus thermoaerophilus]TMV14386.1 hypothetical protein FE781_10715 [Paenibacillus thermoaerophilus]
MLKSQIARDDLMDFAARVREEFHIDALVEGLEYQQKGLVYNAEMSGCNRLSGRVLTPEGPVAATLDFDFLAISDCTCGTNEYCGHMAALFLYAYAAYEHPDRFVKELRAPRPAPAAMPAAAAASRAGARDGSSSLASGMYPAEWGLHPPEPGGWEKLLKDVAERHEAEQTELKRRSPQAFFARMHEAMERSASRWDRRAQRLYSLAGLLVAIESAVAWSRSPRSTRPYYEPEALYLQRLLEPLTSKFGSLISPETAADIREAPPSLDAAVRETRRMLRSRALRTENEGVRWTDFYRLSWLRPLRRDDWVRQELIMLGEEDADPSLKGLLLAHLEALRGEDEAAWAWLRPLAPLPWPTIELQLSDLTEQREWGRLRDWLAAAPSLLAPNDPWTLHHLHPYWAACAEHLDCGDRWLALLADAMPRSYSLYVDALFKLGRYREWVSFHMAHRLGTDDADRAAYKELESKRPELLLPWLHQESERHILQKNRAAYRMAVRLLKRLRTIYKKLKRSDEFEAYVERLSEMHGRLRAFQEELRKGKLIG